VRLQENNQDVSDAAPPTINKHEAADYSMQYPQPKMNLYVEPPIFRYGEQHKIIYEVTI